MMVSWWVWIWEFRLDIIELFWVFCGFVFIFFFLERVMFLLEILYIIFEWCLEIFGDVVENFLELECEFFLNCVWNFLFFFCLCLVCFICLYIMCLIRIYNIVSIMMVVVEKVIWNFDMIIMKNIEFFIVIFELYIYVLYVFIVICFFLK